MAKKNSKTKAKQEKTSKLVFSEILSYAVWAYLFMMLTVFPLYVRDRFVYVAAYKVVYYRNISLLFLGIGLILLIVWSVTDQPDLSKQRWARASLIWAIIGIVATMVIGALFGALIAGLGTAYL